MAALLVMSHRVAEPCTFNTTRPLHHLFCGKGLGFIWLFTHLKLSFFLSTSSRQGVLNPWVATPRGVAELLFFFATEWQENVN